MFLNNIKIGSKLIIAPAVAVIFLFILAIFSNNALKSDKAALKEIVEVKFELYKSSSKLLIDVDLYNSVLYKVFSYAAGGYEQSQIDEQLEILAKIGIQMNKDMKALETATYLDAKTKKMIKVVSKNLKEYNLTVADAIDMLSVDVGMATPMLSVTDEVFLLLNEDLTKIDEMAVDENNIAYEKALEEIDETLYTLYTLIIVGFILSLVIILSVISSIKKPLDEFQSGLLNFFKYLNKETSDVKLIEINSKDELGEMAIAVNNGISTIKEGIEQDRVLVDSTISCATQAQKGLLNARIEGSSSNPSLNELKDVINDMLCSIEDNIKNAMDVLSTYTQYDYRSKIDTSTMDGDLKALCEDVNSLGTAITSMLIENKKIGLTLSNNSENLSNNVESLTESANNQAASLEETAAAIEEITSNMQNSSQNIAKMTSFANEVSSSVSIGQDLASKTASSMDEINEQTQAIADSITVIDQIAFQTNILSLNAAVEAATAGEAGKGFAVVAQEVRNLASRSAEAAKEIKELVESATEKANGGKAISNNMIEGYEKLNSNIHNTLELINDVSGSSKEQFDAMAQINDTVNNLDRVTQQNALSAGEANKVAREVNSIAVKVVEHTDEKEFEGK
ncbi:methyl-accepting chemotaxis protein [Poseidonibacter lekithochrous]|uniref:methyl-accepting chemotaxis protein n=1 Tax=Poseidonibacter lekithochrous TaxID=1904463 RepID=UPI0008FC3E33|nr:methyl-accepting chemotaxis protein [Poseidonibacter lekithochrous]QKJ24136.1 MCP-domain signal transduction protein [Poseidonibacter lekithochrous]